MFDLTELEEFSPEELKELKEAGTLYVRAKEYWEKWLPETTAELKSKGKFEIFLGMKGKQMNEAIDLLRGRAQEAGKEVSDEEAYQLLRNDYLYPPPEKEDQEVPFLP